MKRLIGLTGGIATGKTTVANYLASTYSLPVLDADIYARDAVTVGSPILKAIALRIGEQILLPDGSLNRQKLGEIIFQQPDERNWIEGLIHPYVADRFKEAIAQSSSPRLVLVIPLLFEARMTNLVTEIWVVSCSESQQLQRLIQRNNLSQQQAQARIDSQLSLTKKASLADVVLDNSSTLEVLLKQIHAAVTKISIN
ncbi:dephospho-CoA kinase [Nostocaceae cyanobacterium CENA369]|uniref:Dephospho-CoA kinase n=1 Tax=Dendronalium phyllosphericum CENA369 TaxID=1725256 RepID=A0A8J7IAS5_9NOST|nr:dephospho-CoA kinase [Dendronalium phyllosphericum]MBH8576848.1 dephospho-CoA kinase [Dendronalium phyllosphericum CENA369]